MRRRSENSWTSWSGRSGVSGQSFRGLPVLSRPTRRGRQTARRLRTGHCAARFHRRMHSRASPRLGKLLGRAWMAKEEGIEMEGVVTEVLPDRNYRVLLENGHEILAYAAGKMSKFKIRVLEGDRVSVVLSPYDLTRGRVMYRHK